jgi:hypothetical protein
LFGTPLTRPPVFRPFAIYKNLVLTTQNNQRGQG